MDNRLIKNISEYAKLFSQKKYIESGYIAVRESDGIAITVSKADLNNIGENDVVFVNDKNIESFDGNFRAAAVILFCAIRQDKMSEAAAIVDSDSILAYSNKRKPLQPVMDNVAKLLGVTVKCSSKNVAAEIVTSLSGYRNACFMPDAGAVIKARNLKELLEATNVLDKACQAEILAENKGGTQHLNPVNALIEQVIYKFTTRSDETRNAVKQDNNDAEASATQNAETENKSVESDCQSADNGGDNAKPADCQSGVSTLKNSDIARKVALEGGKIVAIACPCHISAVSAIGKPMTVTAEYKDRLGEEIKCLPSKMILSNKALAKVAELMGEDDVCFMAQHGAVIKADGEQKLLQTIELLENASKAYFEA